MKTKGNMLFKPGTLFLFVVIAALAYGMFNWADTSLGETTRSSLEDQKSALACSNLEISNSGIQTSDNQVEIFFKSNKDLKGVKVSFEGEETVNKTVKDINSGMINSASANMTEYSKISIRTPTCDRVFRFE